MAEPTDEPGRSPDRERRANQAGTSQTNSSIKSVNGTGPFPVPTSVTEDRRIEMVKPQQLGTGTPGPTTAGVGVDQTNNALTSRNSSSP
jgi:hypothetical protein